MTSGWSRQPAVCLTQVTYEQEHVAVYLGCSTCSFCRLWRATLAGRLPDPPRCLRMQTVQPAGQWSLANALPQCGTLRRAAGGAQVAQGAWKRAGGRMSWLLKLLSGDTRLQCEMPTAGTIGRRGHRPGVGTLFEIETSAGMALAACPVEPLGPFPRYV